MSETPAFVEINVNGENLIMEGDTGSPVTIGSLDLFREKFGSLPIAMQEKNFSGVWGYN